MAEEDGGPRASGLVDRYFARELSNPDLGRGLRGMLSFMAPLALGISGRLPVELIFAAIAAQNIALVDVKGAYGLRLSLLLAMTAIIAAASALGALAGHPLGAALAATALIALGAGLWRHLSSDYGPSLATVSALLAFVAMAEKGGVQAARDHAIAALVGGGWGVALQLALWPIRPQHPLRLAVGETWLALARVCTAPPALGAEAGLRGALDRTAAFLDNAGSRKGRLLGTRLEELNWVAARLAQRISAFQSAYEETARLPGRVELQPVVDTIHTVLGNLARTVALAVVSRQPGHWAAVEVRCRRLNFLLGDLQGRIDALDERPSWAALAAAARLLDAYVPTVAAALRPTMDRAADAGAFSLELSDFGPSSLRPLAAALNLSRRVDPALIRYTARTMVLTLIGVAAMKTLPLRHGYWLPFTMVVVLQLDFGATRRKAAERLIGTLAGSILGSLVLALRLPFPVLMAATAATAFVFGYFLRRRYALAVVFITLFVVVLTESLGPATLELTVERVGDTVAGGLFALFAAFIFWPAWERDRFRPILARAISANAAYLRLAGERVAAGQRYDHAVVRAKRAAERANAAVFSSLQRMSGDPEGFRDRMSELAALANANQRVTRALNLILLQAHPDGPAPGAAEFAARSARALDELAAFLAGAQLDAGVLVQVRTELQRRPDRVASTGAPGIARIQLERADAEIGGMLRGSEELAKPSASAS